MNNLGFTMRTDANIAGNDGLGSTDGVPRKFADHSINDAWGYTYFARRGDLIKIGHSGAPKERMQSLGKPLDVLAVIPNPIISEGAAHVKFAHLREKGEWFRIAPELLEFIEWAKLEAVKMPDRNPSQDIDLTHESTRRNLIAMRAKFGADTAPGRRCSNLVEQMDHYRTATGEQKEHLGKSIKLQMKELAELAAAVSQKQ